MWRKGGGFTPLTLYAVQLALNLAWSPIFFKKHELGFALADVTGAAPSVLTSLPQVKTLLDSFLPKRLVPGCCSVREVFGRYLIIHTELVSAKGPPDMCCVPCCSFAGSPFCDDCLLPQCVPHRSLPAGPLLWLDPVRHRPHIRCLQDEPQGERCFSMYAHHTRAPLHKCRCMLNTYTH